MHLESDEIKILYYKYLNYKKEELLPTEYRYPKSIYQNIEHGLTIAPHQENVCIISSIQFLLLIFSF